MRPVETRYVKNGKVRIAYQVLGEGPLDLVVVSGLASHLDLLWENPPEARFYAAFAEFSRLILFDKRGIGRSDRKAGIPGLETRMDDLLAVMEAAGAARPVILGVSEGGKMALTFATTYPERVRALVLYGAFARSPSRAWPPEQVEGRFALLERVWGVPMLPPTVAPSMATDQAFRRRWAHFESRSASPATAGALLRMDHELDVTDILTAVRVPTLVMHRAADQRIGVEHGRHLAAHIPGAAYAELPGADHLPYIGESDLVLGALREFLTGLAAAS